MLNVWTENSGYSLGTFQEQSTLDLLLPVQNDDGVSYKVISGAMPEGLFIIGNKVIGSPLVVQNETTYKFCIRASRGAEVSDRTFTITVSGFNPPAFLTPPGLLAVGPNKQLYTTDQTYIEYQIDVLDLDVATGNVLKFYIAPGDGKLPPGLTLSESGLISGYIKPSPKIPTSAGTGNYDLPSYDTQIYDFGLKSTNGFDSYKYDDVIFDYAIPTIVSQTLSLNYQFKVTVTDGFDYGQRIFRIFVVGNDDFRADSLEKDGLAGSFTADSSYIRGPVWITKGNLGIFRANNYLTVPVALYNPENVSFRLEATNKEVYALGYQLATYDNIAGSTSVSIINATVAPVAGQYFTLNYYVDGASEDLYQIASVTHLTGNRYRISIKTPLKVTIPNNTVFYIGTLGKLPPGVSFDQNTGDIYGRVPYQPAVSEEYTFTITATKPGDKVDELLSASRTFNLVLLGDINSVITWNTPSDLGTVVADYVCTLSVNASTNIEGAVVTYKLIKGSLPPGITLGADGELIGVVTQFGENTSGFLQFLDGGFGRTGYEIYIDGGAALSTFDAIVDGQPEFVTQTGSTKTGLITIDSGSTTFDEGTTTYDRSYTFTVAAADQYGYSALTREFTVKVATANSVKYRNLTARPFLIPAQRALWNSFITNNTLFPPEYVYRPEDKNFGLQTDLTMLVYAGIESVDAAAYIGAMGLNHKRKRFAFGSVEKAIAVDPATNKQVYEVVYIQMYDPMEPNGKRLPSKIRTFAHGSESITSDIDLSIWSRNIDTININAPSNRRPDYNVTIDSTGFQVGNQYTNTYYPNSISNWQTNIKNIANASSERNYLPLWMRSIQPGKKEQLGYALAIPLCFCKVGTADTILLNIKHSNFNFSTIDYTIDRFTITSLAGYFDDKYLIFKNDRITV